MPWLLVSVLAASFAAGASAQDIDWRKVDAAFGRKPAVLTDVHVASPFAPEGTFAIPAFTGSRHGHKRPVRRFPKA
jgi:hypothetical protein